MRGRTVLRRQRGWIGLVVMLVALVIVAMLAKTALERYGLLGPGVAGRAAERSAISPAGSAPVDYTREPPAPTSALERARGVESMVRQQAEERAKRSEGEGP